jgi:hypothetical protein
LLRSSVAALPQQAAYCSQSGANTAVDDEAEDERRYSGSDDDSMHLADGQVTTGGQSQVRRDEGNYQNDAQDATNELSDQTSNQAGDGAGANAPGDPDSVHAGDESQRQRYQKGQAA